MNELQLFANEQFGSIRTLEMNGEVWFVGKDVADALGYERPTKAVGDHVDPEDRDEVPIQDSIGRMQKTPIINESGLYSLVLSSKMPTVKQFKRWITSEVLPAIRKHGAYLTPAKIEAVLADPDTIIQLATNLKAERQKRAESEKQIEADKPKVLFAEAVSASHTSILVGELAKILRQNGVDMGQNRLFEWLRGHGYLIKSGSSRNMPRQRAMEQGLFEIKETTITNPDGSIRVTKTPKVTGKGQQYFVNLFLSEIA